jgi:hypothetical protein
VTDINTDVFELITAYSEVLNLIVKNIPLGMNAEEDKAYNLDIRDGLFECTLLLFRRVTEYFGCPPLEKKNDKE